MIKISILKRWLCEIVKGFKENRVKRAVLKKWLCEIVKEYENKPYEYWASIAYPIVFQRTIEGKEIQVEIHTLESTPEYFHISFSVDDGLLSADFPVGTDIIVRKDRNEKS